MRKFHGTLKNCETHESLAQQIFPIYDIQKCLLMEGNQLSLSKTISLAQGYEMGEKDTTELLPQQSNL